MDWQRVKGQLPKRSGPCRRKTEGATWRLESGGRTELKAKIVVFADRLRRVLLLGLPQK